jgi:hypothetical protein
MSIRWCEIRARAAASGFAVPMSMPRYTSAESTLMMSSDNCPATRIAISDFPDPVGPINKIARRRINARAKKADQDR